MDVSRRVIVTGAASGIGSAIARELAQAGWQVVIADIDADGAIKLAAEINANVSDDGQAAAVELDVSCECSVKALYAKLQSEEPRPSALVNNAGVQTWSPLTELSLDDWNRTLGVNLTGCFLMTREFARMLAASGAGGDIVNIGSGCNRLAFPHLVDYTASKGGIEMFTKSAALELGPAGIQVNCIAPGAIETERTRGETGDYAASWAPLTPLRRTGEVSDVAQSVRMLLEQPSGFITGQTLAVDGGLFSAAAWPQTY